MESPYLRGLFLSAYHRSFSHLDNTEAMFSHDLMNMLLLLFDNRFTGEHNTSVKQAKNPKRKTDPSQLKEVESILKMIMQGFPRWSRIYEVQQYQESEGEELIVLQIMEAGRKNIKQD